MFIFPKEKEKHLPSGRFIEKHKKKYLIFLFGWIISEYLSCADANRGLLGFLWTWCKNKNEVRSIRSATVFICVFSCKRRPIPPCRSLSVYMFYFISPLWAHYLNILLWTRELIFTVAFTFDYSQAVPEVVLSKSTRRSIGGQTRVQGPIKRNTNHCCCWQHCQATFTNAPGLAFA